MNITRNNYEEFFLLYSDGELNAADRLAVENFVKFHPDLAEELEMLMDAVLPAEMITMPAKELLLKPELADLGAISADQESMLMMMDGELDINAAKQLQLKLETDKALAAEWNLLQQTKLPASLIEMPGKESLYRHEKDRKPIPIGGWVKWMAIAAMITGLGWFGLQYLGNENNQSEGLAVTVTPVKPTSKAAESSTPVTRPAVDEHQAIAVNPSKKVTTTVIPAGNRKQEFAEKKESALPIQQVKEAETEYAVAVKPSELVKTAEPDPSIALADNKTIDNPIIKTINNAEETPAVARQAVYKEDASSTEDEYVNIAGARIKKQKLRGVFRNVTRTIGRTFEKSNVAQADMASLR
jgi:anti-sigma factor RsiW